MNCSSPTRFLWLGLAGLAMPAAAAPDFKREVQPILEVSCVRCHNPEKAKGDLQLHTEAAALKGGKDGPAYIAGSAKASELIRRVMLPPEDEEFMPHQGDPLSKSELQILKQWVASGAEWPEGAVLEQRKSAQEVAPEADGLVLGTAPRSEADAIARVGQILDQENAQEHPDLPVAGAIGDLAFLRKATVDLIGRIPSHAEIAEYTKWPSGDRRQRLVEKLLEEPRFNERWTVFFADLLRIRANATGGRELLAHVHRSIAEKKPWDEMAFELIAANGATKKTPAVGFILNDDAQPLELAAATAQVFLGVRMQCAMCHDHPFDDWKQKEFYEFAGFFGKTTRVENRFSRQVYTTEGHEMMVKWPPERDKPPVREAVAPKFPFELVSYDKQPHFLKRLEERRQPVVAEAALPSGESLDDLLDIDAVDKATRGGLDVLGEAKQESRQLEVEKDLYKQSQLRAKLAALVTDPRNPYFARAFVNRVWAELMGRGFVEPLDNFSDYNATEHPQTLDYLAQEFIASGFDLRALLKLIVMSEPYRRGHLGDGFSAEVSQQASEAYAAAAVRRMLSEPLYDSIVLAGHLDDFKWPVGANVRKVQRQIRIPLGPEANDGGPPMAEGQAMAAMDGESRRGSYDLEQGIGLDFEEILKQADREAREIEQMKREQDAKLKAAEQAAMMAEANRPVMRYALKTIEEEVDDNPKFDSTLLMASPAPPDHFLRVFGQPSRDRLGEFRDQSPSMRQALMMINGKATHEASRVGPLEPLYKKLSNPSEAVRFAYLEILTREPEQEELADALALIEASADAASGLADLRWALFNCHEFRYLP